MGAVGLKVVVGGCNVCGPLNLNYFCTGNARMRPRVFKIHVGSFFYRCEHKLQLALEISR